jgi:Nucleotidyl transferase AbiEii toxin, Type IV TA system
MDAPSQKKITWHVESLPPPTSKALVFLSTQSWLKKSIWYLAGGTALALQAGHRSSVDLDFFTAKSSFHAPSLLRHFKTNWKTTVLEEGTVYGELHRAKVSFLSYPFFKPSLPLARYGAVCVLQPRDIAVMKVITISQRGRKRDFIDLYWCMRNIEPLENIIIRLKTQYPSVAHDFHHILKSMTYFVDAEREPLPKLYFKASWPQVKKMFINEVPDVTRKLMKLNP